MSLLKGRAQTGPIPMGIFTEWSNWRLINSTDERCVFILHHRSPLCKPEAFQVTGSLQGMRPIVLQSASTKAYPGIKQVLLSHHSSHPKELCIPHVGITGTQRFSSCSRPAMSIFQEQPAASWALLWLTGGRSSIKGMAGEHWSPTEGVGEAFGGLFSSESLPDLQLDR